VILARTKQDPCGEKPEVGSDGITEHTDKNTSKKLWWPVFHRERRAIRARPCVFDETRNRGVAVATALGKL